VVGNKTNHDIVYRYSSSLLFLLNENESCCTCPKLSIT